MSFLNFQVEYPIECQDFMTDFGIRFISNELVINNPFGEPSARDFGNGRFIGNITFMVTGVSAEALARFNATMGFLDLLGHTGTWTRITPHEFLPTFPADEGDATVTSSVAGTNGVFETTLNANRPNIQLWSFLKTMIDSKPRILRVVGKPSDNVIYTLPNINLSGKTLQRADTIDVRQRDYENFFSAQVTQQSLSEFDAVITWQFAERR